MAPAVDTALPIPSLLGDLSGVEHDHIRDVARLKRFLERWTMDPAFRDAYVANPEAAIASLGLDLRRDEVHPFVDDEAARTLTRAIREGADGDYPLSVRRYRAFYREKRQHRRQIRKDCQPGDRRLALWRARQVQRCIGQLGVQKADALVHAPAAFELARGCSVGCWFCGVAAPRLGDVLHYDEEVGQLWRGTLRVLRDLMGPCVKQGFLYWATDPLDNPDYERFLLDFHAITGRCPQTTTAMGARNIERTRQLLRLSHSLQSTIDRFSVLTLSILKQLHASFTPEEFIRVECIPQNREAADKYRKANAGRARTFETSRGREMMPRETSSTIACVSGFLFNMLDRTVKLITPCNASPRWPLGYWVIAEAQFTSPDDLRDQLDAIVDRCMPTSLHYGDRVAPRPDLIVSCDDRGLNFRSRWICTTFHNVPHQERLAQLLQDGVHTAGDIALAREREGDVPLTDTFLLLDAIFGKGLLDEEPRPATGAAAAAAAV